MIGSSEINKIIRKILAPALLNNGFIMVKGKKYWKVLDHSVEAVEIRAVGSYFSEVTGWPPMSCIMHCGIYFTIQAGKTSRPSMNATCAG